MKRETLVGLIGILVLVTGVVALTTLNEGSESAAGAQTGATTPVVPGLQALTPEAFTLADCTVVEALVVIPADRARGVVPPAFAPVEGPQGVNAVLGGSACEQGPSGAPTAFGLLAIEVTPDSDALRDPGVSRYYFKPEVHLPPAELAYLFSKFHGTFTTVDQVLAQGGLTGVTFRIAGGGWEHRVTAPVSPPAPGTGALDARFREYSAAEGGYAFLDATWKRGTGTVQSATPGTFQTGEGTVAREVLGASGPASVVHWTHMEYAGANIGFLPTPP